MTDDNSREGHRKRLRERFIESGLSGFADYEIVELLLTLGSPRKDCKRQAKESVKKFKTLKGVLDASSAELQQINGIGPHNSFGISLVQEVARRYLKEKIIDTPVFTSSQEIFDYLYHSMRGLKKEVFKVLYLNSQNRVIEIEDLFQGTVDSSVVHIREVIESAIRHKAVSMIFVHNHPSGNPSPSQSDKDLTRDLIMAAGAVGLKVLDHIVIGDNKYYSFSGEGLTPRYEADFLVAKAENRNGR